MDFVAATLFEPVPVFPVGFYGFARIDQVDRGTCAVGINAQSILPSLSVAIIGIDLRVEGPGHQKAATQEKSVHNNFFAKMIKKLMPVNISGCDAGWHA
jgi:hypothetical protein